MKSFFIFLSKRKGIKKFIESFPPSKKLVDRFISGENLDDALNAIKKLNSENIMATVDHLGENVENENDAMNAASIYIEILERIKKENINSNVSIKLTQMGLDIGDDFCYENVKRILEKAKELNNFVRIDMEGSPYTQRTIDLYKRLRKEFPKNVGIVLQAYLYRTENDLKDLFKDSFLNVRICKGAYKEPKSIAFPRKKDVDENFKKLLIICFENIERVYPAIATHDEKIINWVKEFLKEKNIPKEKFEFQMLYGIRYELQKILANEGYKVRVYVPYGREWYPYFMRRLGERPANCLFILKNLFKK
ncbi:MAG: proline dehydrogenase family protein [candidate division WOR-3 bacterium]